MGQAIKGTDDDVEGLAKGQGRHVAKNIPKAGLDPFRGPGASGLGLGQHGRGDLNAQDGKSLSSQGGGHPTRARAQFQNAPFRRRQLTKECDIVRNRPICRCYQVIIAR